MQQVKIIIDNRERNAQIISCLKSKNVILEFRQMPVGDYILSDRVCVERKTESDLQGSIINARLFDQLDRLRQSFEKPIVIIEADMGGFNLGDNAMLGIVASIYLDYNMPILLCSNAQDTANTIYSIAAREQSDNKREPRLIGIKRAYSDYQWQILVLRSIPGIGEKLAGEMLRHFGSVRNVANASPNELMGVEKIGKKKAQRIWEVLNKEINN